MTVSVRGLLTRLERGVAPLLESGVQRREFTDSLVVAKKLQRAVATRIESAATDVLHLLGIPARSDFKRATAQLRMIETELRALSHEVQEQRSTVARRPE